MSDHLRGGRDEGAPIECDLLVISNWSDANGRRPEVSGHPCSVPIDGAVVDPQPEEWPIY
jgi:hypothetical protein